MLARETLQYLSISYEILYIAKLFSWRENYLVRSFLTITVTDIYCVALHYRREWQSPLQKVLGTTQVRNRSQDRIA